MSEFIRLKATGQDIAVQVRCYMLSAHGDGKNTELKACVLAGEFQEVKAVFAALVTAGTQISAGTTFYKKCEHSYRVQYTHLSGRWALAHIRSNDPRIIWAAGDDGVAEMLSHPEIEVPYLKEWVPEIVAELARKKMIVNLKGHKPRGRILAATTEALDQIVSKGVKSFTMPLPKEYGARKLAEICGVDDQGAVVGKIESYVTEFSLALAKKVEGTMRPLHNPAVDSPDPIIGGLPTQLYPPQAHVATAMAKCLQAERFGFLACNMGTGKTAMGLVACHVHSSRYRRHKGKVRPYRMAIACPPHLVEKWEREVRKFMGQAANVTILQDWRHFMRLRDLPRPVKNEYYVIAMTKAKLSYGRRPAIHQARVLVEVGSADAFGGKRKIKVMSLVCPKCSWVPRNMKGEPATIGDLSRKWSFCKAKVCPKCQHAHQSAAKACERCDTVLATCGEALWQGDAPVKVSPADYGRKRMRCWFDYFIRDEAHGSKAADSLDGYACSAMMQMSRWNLLMTGTFLAGKAEDIRPILFKAMPTQFVSRGHTWKDDMGFAQVYGRVDTITRSTEYHGEDKRHGRASDKKTTQVIKPGIMPRLFMDFCCNNVAFLSLHDMSLNLPTYSEHTFKIEMSPELAAGYQEMQEELLAEFRALYVRNRGCAMKLLGPMLEALMTWPDYPFDWKPIGYDDPKDGRIEVYQPWHLEQAGPFPKEAELLTQVKEEMALGRKTWVYCTRTKTRERLYRLLTEAGYRVAHLEACVEPAKREAWIKRNALDCQIGLCHPKLVETGLELFDPAEPRFNFPTLLWYATGFELNTLRQASRRVWRIGQLRQCKTNYLFYGDTAQQEAIALMGLKLRHAEAIEGKFSDGGLVDEAADTDLALAIAKNLAENIRTATVQTWKPVTGLMTEDQRRGQLTGRLAALKAKMAARTLV